MTDLEKLQQERDLYRKTLENIAKRSFGSSAWFLGEMARLALKGETPPKIEPPRGVGVGNARVSDLTKPIGSLLYGR